MSTYEIPLPSGHVGLVDMADRDLVDQYRWHVHQNRRNAYIRGGLRGHSPSRTYLHRLLLEAPPGVLVDHRNGNGLDNRRANLRLATDSQNSGNARPRPSAGSPYKGVSWDPARVKWAAYITLKGRKLHLGRFDDEWVAAEAYNAAAAAAWGEFARPNVRLEATSGMRP